MFEIAQKEGFAKDRDEMRRLEKDVQKRLQQLAAKAIAQIQGNIIIDTHASVKTPKRNLPGTGMGPAGNHARCHYTC